MANSKSDNSKTTILVSDDEPSTLALVAGHLRSKGYKIIEASDGDQAWELACEHLPNLVVLDVMMPGMSGWEVCRKIREAVSLAHTGVVMLTGIGESLNELTSPLYGADAYVDKPFEFGELDRQVEAALMRRQSGALGRAVRTRGPEASVPPAPKAPSLKKLAAKKPVAKKPAPKKAAPEKVAPTKAALKKAPAKVTPKAAKKAKKQAVKKAKPPAKKAAVKKALPKKGPTKKAQATKGPAKKASKKPSLSKKPGKAAPKPAKKTAPAKAKAKSGTKAKKRGAKR